jgi:hypothetical protein
LEPRATMEPPINSSSPGSRSHSVDRVVDAKPVRPPTAADAGPGSTDGIPIAHGRSCQSPSSYLASHLGSASMSSTRVENRSSDPTSHGQDQRLSR